MIRRPPESTLFPYPTPSRLPSRNGQRCFQIPDCVKRCWIGSRIGHTLSRSEEHTSELQSRQYLVCRLLLEKKNNMWSRHLACRTAAPRFHHFDPHSQT